MRNTTRAIRRSLSGQHFARTLESTRLIGDVFEDKNMKASSLKHCELQSVRFRRCNMEGADFYWCDLRDTVFEDCRGEAAFRQSNVINLRFGEHAGPVSFHQCSGDTAVAYLNGQNVRMVDSYMRAELRGEHGSLETVCGRLAGNSELRRLVGSCGNTDLSNFDFSETWIGPELLSGYYGQFIAAILPHYGEVRRRLANIAKLYPLPPAMRHAEYGVIAEMIEDETIAMLLQQCEANGRIRNVVQLWLTSFMADTKAARTTGHIVLPTVRESTGPMRRLQL